MKIVCPKNGGSENKNSVGRRRPSLILFCTLSAAGRAGSLGRFRLCTGQCKGKNGVFSDLALDPDLAARAVDQLFADVQSQAAALSMQTTALVRLEKPVEDIGQRLGGDALSGIQNSDGDKPLFLVFGTALGGSDLCGRPFDGGRQYDHPLLFLGRQYNDHQRRF